MWVPGEGGLEYGTGPVRCQWLFSKQLTASDTNKLGRIILPRQAVEHFLPWVEERAGLDLNTCDTAGIRWAFKLKCGPNCVTISEEDDKKRGLGREAIPL